MDWSDLLTRIVAWLRAGYPQGVPEQDYIPLLAVLGRRLSDDEINQVVDQLVQQGALPADRVGAGVAITRVAHELPSESDLARVRDRLRAAGWPVEGSWQPPGTNAEATIEAAIAADPGTPADPDTPADTETSTAPESVAGPGKPEPETTIEADPDSAARAEPGEEPRAEVQSSMRTRYHDNLRELAQLLHAMCLRDRTAIATATDALLTVDLEQSQNAIDIGGDVEGMYRKAEHEAMRLLALEAPVAGELRQVVTALQLTGNLQRMAALATHIATAARRRHPEPLIPAPMRPLMARMGAAAVSIATDAAAVLDSPDPDLAAMLDIQDDTMDHLHEQLLATVLGPAWEHGITAAVDLTLVGRYYERFADNAVEVGRRTIFLATGETADQWVPARADDLD